MRTGFPTKLNKTIKEECHAFKKWKSARRRRTGRGLVLRHRSGLCPGEGVYAVVIDLQGRPNDADQGRQQQSQCSEQRQLRRRERVSATVLGEPAGCHTEF